MLNTSNLGAWSQFILDNSEYLQNSNKLSNYHPADAILASLNYKSNNQGCCISTDENEKKKGENEMADNNMFNGMFGKVANGMCRLSMSGGIAVKTSNGYKSYDTKKKRLTNCSNFVFKDFGEDFFFVIPTNKVEPGDIILVSGKPKCVISVNADTITVINYEDSTVDTILPERHIFMGNTYFYGKIVSMFGDDISGSGKNKTGKIMKYMMLSEMMKGMNGNNSNNPMSSMLPFMMLGGGSFGDIFDGFGDMFSFDEEEDDCSDIEDGAEK